MVLIKGFKAPAHEDAVTYGDVAVRSFSVGKGSEVTGSMICFSSALPPPCVCITARSPGGLRPAPVGSTSDVCLQDGNYVMLN